MSNVAESLDSATTELREGVSLVEASAGTGKTYAIAMLVLRSVVELGVPVESILVVTFTRAATEELKSRIRARLAEAREALEQESTEVDATMQLWLERVTDRSLALHRLRVALLDIDRAAIFTIHSFCQRMLTEQALESGQLFALELQADVRHVMAEVAEDFWRKNVYSLPGLSCAVLTREYATPEQLLAGISGALRDEAQLLPATLPLSTTMAQLELAYDAFSTWWKANAQNLQQYFLQGDEDGVFKKPLSGRVNSWLESVERFACESSQPLPDNLEFLTAEGLQTALNSRKVKKNVQQSYLREWTLSAGEVTTLLTSARDFVLSVRAALCDTVADQLESRLEEMGHLSFDDLIIRLDRALATGDGDVKERLGSRYQVGLIDEFQDTDSAQWRIFSNLFSRKGQVLFLIGDPKQAIYRFRGADIHSYFQARESADRSLTLPKNYRSHPSLVSEVNNLFAQRQEPFGFPESMLPFYPVEAARGAEDGYLSVDKVPLPSVTYCQLPAFADDKKGRWSSGRASEAIVDAVVAEICRQLSPGGAHICRSVNGETLSRPLEAGDIAILVRSNLQADRFQQACSKAGIPAIITSKKSVFETAECEELLRLLQGILAPGDTGKIKAAMTVSWFNLTGDQLVAIMENELEFEEWLNRFLLYSQLWKESGFLTMMNELLAIEEVFPALARLPLGQRCIANIQQLLELVQQAESEERLGPEQTLLWIKSMRQDRGTGGEDRELRLESDEQAVQIITMHSAKGLQFPVVFCPFLWYRSSRLRHERHVITCHDEDKGLIADIGSERFDLHRQRATAEELAEDLRLLYVALTRAELCNYIYWVDTRAGGMVAGSVESALGYLLGLESAEFTQHQDILRKRGGNHGVEYRLLTSEEPVSRLKRANVNHYSELTLRPFPERALQTDYGMSSYSALAQLSDYDDHGSDPYAADERSDGPDILHPGLPAGANFGNLVHDSFELLGFRAIAKGKNCDSEIARLCSRYGINLETQQVLKFLQTVVAAPLSPSTAPGLSLMSIDPGKCLFEMPFYFHLSRLETRQLNELLEAEETVISLNQRTLQGHLTGFVDLFFEYENKFYIVDYKTNYLGEKLGSYNGENLVQAMAGHNYGLQYWLYTLVLHTHLQNVLPHYSYQHHFGGVMYLFVRGMSADKPGNGVYATHPDYDKLSRLASLLTSGGD